MDDLGKDEVAFVHDTFRALAALAKWMLRAAIVCELIAAIVALGGSIWGDRWAVWAPALSVLLVFLAVIGRTAAGAMMGRARYFRHESLLAYAMAQSLPPGVVADAELNEPPSLIRDALLWRSPTSSMASYYEPTLPEGAPRLHELLAHSAYFTTTLLWWHARFLGFLTGVVVIACLMAVNMLVQAPPPETTSLALSVMYSIVLGALGIRAFEEFLKCTSAASDAQGVLDRLMALEKPQAPILLGLSHKYDAALAAGTPTPSYLYRIMNRRLTRAWHARRRELWSNYGLTPAIDPASAPPGGPGGGSRGV